jgi:hypothetical protein
MLATRDTPNQVLCDLLDKYDRDFRSVARDDLKSEIRQLQRYADEERQYLESCAADAVYSADDPDDPDDLAHEVEANMEAWWHSELAPSVTEMRAAWLAMYPKDETEKERIEKMKNENRHFHAENLRCRAELDQTKAEAERWQEQAERNAEALRLEQEVSAMIRDARYCRNCDEPLY